jgi:cytochrome oxidase assembly protein ShyY1
VTGLVVDPGRVGGTAGPDLAPLLDGDGVLPALVQLDASDPAEPAADDGEAPLVPLEPPELSEGPHLGYAAQWFIFSTIAVVGYPIILRRVVIRRGKEVDDEAGDGPGDRDDLDREIEGLLREGS